MKSQAPKATTIMLIARAGRGPIHRPSSAVTRRYTARSPRPAAMTSTKTSAAVRGRSTNEGPAWHAHQVPQLPLPPLSQCDPDHERDRRAERECPPRFPARLPRLTVGELAPHPCSDDS